jgi:hypothetical protein
MPNVGGYIDWPSDRAVVRAIRSLEAAHVGQIIDSLGCCFDCVYGEAMMSLGRLQASHRVYNVAVGRGVYYLVWREGIGPRQRLSQLEAKRVEAKEISESIRALESLLVRERGKLDRLMVDDFDPQSGQGT